jgi:hypothetical protein
METALLVVEKSLLLHDIPVVKRAVAIVCPEPLQIAIQLNYYF